MTDPFNFSEDLAEMSEWNRRVNREHDRLAEAAGKTTTATLTEALMSANAQAYRAEQRAAALWGLCKRLARERAADRYEGEHLADTVRRLLHDLDQLEAERDSIALELSQYQRQDSTLRMAGKLRDAAEQDAAW